MLVLHEGGPHDAGPAVGNGGYCENDRVVVRSQEEVGQGGVNMEVSAASGAVPLPTAVGADISPSGQHR